MSAPRYAIGDILYVKESAAVGALEAVIISGVEMQPDNMVWVYKVTLAGNPQARATFGDMIQYYGSAKLYWWESELVSACDAYDLAIDYLQARINTITALRHSQCN